MRKSKLIASAAIAAVAGLLLAPAASNAKVGQTVDILLKGGTVYFGDLNPPVTTDIGVDGDQIVFVGDARKANIKSKKTLDVQGMMVAPGFIDAHVHADDEMASPDAKRRFVARQAFQGVTTDVLGVDGYGTPDVGQQLKTYEAAGVGQNVAAYVGFGAVRERILQDSARAPTPAELEEMKALTAKGMCEGALGLSSGLFYAPQSFATTEEVIAVAKEAGKRGGLYDTHQRDEGDSSIGVVTSLKEAIRIGEESGATLHVAHIKVSGGDTTMVDLVNMINAARANGQMVTADQYPWTAANTGLEAAVIPRWAQDGGREAMVKRLNDPADVARIESEAPVPDALAEKIMLSGVPNERDVQGKRLSELAKEWGITPIAAAIRILKTSEADVVVFVMNEQDIVTAMKQPWVMSSSDGAEDEHPRGYASFPRQWTNYVVDQKVLTPVQFVHRSTGLPADTFHLTDRGYIRKGYFADIVVIDPKTYKGLATYTEPTLLSTGVQDILVNGKLEIENTHPTGVLNGRGLTRAPKPGTCS